MITVRMIQYWHDYQKRELQERFRDLDELADWIFGQMRMDYTSGHGRDLLSFPKCDADDSIYNISVRPEYGGYVFWIKLIEDEHSGIVFSDGTFTAGQKHCTKAVREWLMKCEDRKKNPTFNFVPDEADSASKADTIPDRLIKKPANIIEYDPEFWKRAENITVRQFCDYVKEHIPLDALLHVCGANYVYLHFSPEGNAFSLDYDSLSDLPEYENREAGELEIG